MPISISSLKNKVELLSQPSHTLFFFLGNIARLISPDVVCLQTLRF